MRSVNGDLSSSAVQSAQRLARRQSKTSASNQLACRNSKATRCWPRSSFKKRCSRGRSFLKLGAKPKRAGPQDDLITASRLRNCLVGPAAAFSRLKCVIVWGALKAKRKDRGTCSAHERNKA